MKTNLKQIKETARARALHIFSHRVPLHDPTVGQMWMCQVCESTFGQADTVSRIVTCDPCAMRIEAERTFIVTGN